jgi:microcin C transport system permease protein
LLLIILFATGNFVKWFPLRGLWSDNIAQMPFLDKVVDYAWHMTLPIVAMVIGGFATLTFFTKNNFLEEIRKQYVVTARAKGLSKSRVLYGHVFLFSGSVLIEVIFSLDGLGLLGVESLLGRDYPVVFATLYFFSLLGLVIRLVSDIVYVMVDPRIDFEARGG